MGSRSSPKRIQPVILSGGSGTRLWPLSRQLLPKQLLRLSSPRSMLQETVLRVRPGTRFLPPLVICNEAHRFLIAEQLRAIDIESGSIVLEPFGRNTAPAAAVAAIIAARADPDVVLLLLPADHLIMRPRRFQAAIDAAATAARAGNIVTFGIRPDRAETGYGYIHCGGQVVGNEGCFHVNRFIEKPGKKRAEELLTDGNVCWNSGMFAVCASTLLEELERFEPTLLKACRNAVAAGVEDLDFFRISAAAFEAADAISIDVAVMERTTKACVLPVDIGWSDIGSWTALQELGAQDENGNVKLGDVALRGVSNSYVRSEGPLVGVIGLDQVIVVATDDALLVADADRVNEVGELVDTLNNDERIETIAHTIVYRPWGSFQTIDRGDRFQVKRITVKPGGCLSLQFHRKRAEHWVVTRGSAHIVRGEERFVLRENESTFIPATMVHRLENRSPQTLELIEVQSGDYLGEDDIVRLEDVYGRE